MWQTDEIGLATWADGESRWSVDARGGDHAIRLCDRDGQPLLHFSCGDQGSLPIADEQFVRRDAWHVNYPQRENSFALRMAFRPIAADPNRLVLETTVSIQTSLLDTHPTIDIDVDCVRLDTHFPNESAEFDGSGDGLSHDAAPVGIGSAPISIATNESYSVAVLLGPHDSPCTTSHSNDSLLRLRLFGDFLEKGVIRRARPWIVIERADATATSDLVDWWRRLCGSPLPLS